jgi:hypothetical protein
MDDFLMDSQLLANLVWRQIGSMGHNADRTRVDSGHALNGK